MFGGATGVSDTTSGRIFVAPAPDTTYTSKFITKLYLMGYPAQILQLI